MYGHLLKTSERVSGDYRFVTELTFEVDSQDIKSKLPEHCEIKISKFSPTRNLDQNAKYWATVGEIAKITGTAMSVVHNLLLNDYGELEIINDKPIEILLPADFDYLSDRDLHLKPTGQTKLVQGKPYTFYYKLLDRKSVV